MARSNSHSKSTTRPAGRRTHELRAVPARRIPASACRSPIRKRFPTQLAALEATAARLEKLRADYLAPTRAGRRQIARRAARSAPHRPHLRGRAAGWAPIRLVVVRASMPASPPSRCFPGRGWSHSPCVSPQASPRTFGEYRWRAASTLLLAGTPPPPDLSLTLSATDLDLMARLEGLDSRELLSARPARRISFPTRPCRPGQ